MPGLQLASFWEGNRAQLFATHVLSSVAAVVSVPVPMDFGHDLLCTLTRHEHRALYAGRAFGVQVKAIGSPDIRYGGLNSRGEWKGYEIEWLYGQHQPLIVCIVDLKEWAVHLYSTQFMWWVRCQKRIPGEVVLTPDLRLDDFSDAEGRSMVNRYRSTPLPKTAGGSDVGDGLSYSVPLGCPIVSVSVKDQEAAEFRNELRECLDRWLALDYRNLTYMRLGVPYVEELIHWETNKPPDRPGTLWHFFGATKDQNIREILSSVAPAIVSLMHNLNHQRQMEKLEAVKPLAKLIHEYGLLDGTAVNFLKESEK